MNNPMLLAQEIGVGNATIKGPLQGISTLSDLINKMLIFIIPLASIILFFILVWGGIDFLMSQGNPEKIKTGRMKITSGLIGFFILVFSIAIVKLIAFLFGIEGQSPV